MDKKVLVCGATGLIGSALMDNLWNRNGIDVVGTCYKNPKDGYVSMEMQNPHSSIQELFFRVRPKEIYIASYISNVDLCETDGFARVVNIEGIRTMVHTANAINAKIIFISSSYVFDGSKEEPYTIWDRPHPIQQYGIQKLVGEGLVLSNNKHIVARTIGVYGREDARKNFAYQVIDNLSQNKAILVPKDQKINPIHASILASSLVDFVEDGYSGLIHVAGDENLSKYEFAVDIANKFGLDVSKIVGYEGQISGKALRPKNGCLHPNISGGKGYWEYLDLFYEQN